MCLYEDMGCLEKVPLLTQVQTELRTNMEQQEKGEAENKSHNSTCPGGMTNGGCREGDLGRHHFPGDIGTRTEISRRVSHLGT